MAEQIPQPVEQEATNTMAVDTTEVETPTETESTPTPAAPTKIYKSQITASVPVDMVAALEVYCIKNGITEGQGDKTKPVISQLIMTTLAEKIGYTIPVAVKAVKSLTPEELAAKKEAQNAAAKVERENAANELKALRESNRAAAIAALAQSAA